MKRPGEHHPCPGCRMLVPGYFLMCGNCHEKLGRVERERLAAAFGRDHLALTSTIGSILRALTTRTR